MNQFGVIIHIHMEMSQRNYLCSYYKQTKLSFFFFYKKNRRLEWSCLGVGGRVLEGEYGGNTVYSSMQMDKRIPVETSRKVGRRG
jgi:hypothetical protein